MYWQEEQDVDEFVVPENVLDVAYSIECRSLPVDHAHALSQAIADALPWFADEEQAGLHLIHGAESGNGWERPEHGDDVLYLSRRTKLVLRLPRHRLNDAQSLEGQSIKVGYNTLKVGSSRKRLMSKEATLYARYVAGLEGQDEEAFIADMVALLKDAGIRFKKVLCGKETTLKTPEGDLVTRSLMVADLLPEDSVRLQEEGLGEFRKMGCGLFIPHKGV